MISCKLQKHNLVFVLFLFLNQFATIPTSATDINFIFQHNENYHSEVLQPKDVYTRKLHFWIFYKQ